MKEIWKDIAGYEGLYQVSNLGNVRSLNYRRHGYVKQLTPKVNNKGYLWVELSFNRKRRCFSIHRLVAEAFVDNPYDFPEVNHIDEIKQNNKHDNLEWCTHKYNNQYSRIRHPENYVRNVRSCKSYKHNICVEQKRRDGTIVNTYKNIADAVKETGFNNWSITQCCQGIRKQAYGYKWEFAV